MTTSAQRPPSRTQIADLRASVRSARDKPKFEKAPPKPKKPRSGSIDHIEERAEKAERQSQQQHTTSLLTGKASNAYVRKGERRQPSGSILGLFFQIIFVFAFVVGVAYVIDPTILPPEWSAQAIHLFEQVKSHEMVKQWLPA